VFAGAGSAGRPSHQRHHPAFATTAFAFALGTADERPHRASCQAMAVTWQSSPWSARQAGGSARHLIRPKHRSSRLTALDAAPPDKLPGQPDAWLLSSEPINAEGHTINRQPRPPASRRHWQRLPAMGPYLDCLASRGVP